MMRVWFISAADAATAPDPNDLSQYAQPGTLTTDHAASSYGQPVIVAEDGTAYGPGDVLDYAGEPKAPRDKAIEAASEAAGFTRTRNYSETDTTY